MLFFFIPLCLSLHAVTHGSQWLRLPWGSIPIPWTLTSLEWTYSSATWTMRDACTVTDSSAQSGASPALCERSVTNTILYIHPCWKSSHARVRGCFYTDPVITVFTDTRNQPDAHVRERTFYSQPGWKEDGAVLDKCKLMLSVLTGGSLMQNLDTQEEESTLFSVLLLPKSHSALKEKNVLFENVNLTNKT